jgi:uncharacterized membrane protein YgcG
LDARTRREPWTTRLVASATVSVRSIRVCSTSFTCARVVASASSPVSAVALAPTPNPPRSRATWRRLAPARATSPARVHNAPPLAKCVSALAATRCASRVSVSAFAVTSASSSFPALDASRTRVLATRRAIASIAVGRRSITARTASFVTSNVVIVFAARCALDASTVAPRRAPASRHGRSMRSGGESFATSFGGGSGSDGVGSRDAYASPAPAWVKRSVSRTSYRSNVEREARVKSEDGKSP